MIVSGLMKVPIKESEYEEEVCSTRNATEGHKDTDW